MFVTTKDAAEMERRLTNRGTESYEVITDRLKAAIGEAEQMCHYEYVVINDDLQECVAQLNEIILTEPDGPRYDPVFKEQFVEGLKEIVARRTAERI
jgi:guanylate kinase